MKVKNFKAYLEKRLDKKEIASIEKAAKLEHEIFKSLQEDIANAVINHMKEEGVGFNELVTNLGASPSQVSKIINGQANITLATIAHVFAHMKHRPRLMLGKKVN
jgi:antitoxin component HigA of HigAB toxin-antitoxin module